MYSLFLKGFASSRLASHGSTEEGVPNTNFAFLLPFARGCSHREQRRSVEKSGSQVVQQRLGELMLIHRPSVPSASGPRQVTNKKVSFIAFHLEIWNVTDGWVLTGI